MNTLTFSLLLAAAILSTPSAAAEKSIKKGFEKKSTASSEPTTTTLAPIEKLWEPLAFNPQAEHLGVNYRGLDIKNFYALMQSKVDKLKKGEFETTEEHRKRTEETEALMAPLTSKALYAFRVDMQPFSYNADKQRYYAKNDRAYKCLGLASNEDKAERISCTIDAIDVKNDFYVGENVFGATRTVLRSRGSYLGVAVTADKLITSGFFSKNAGNPRLYQSRVEYFFDGSFFVPLDKAREIKEKKIGMLFVGSINEPKIFSGENTFIRESSMDIVTTTKVVPFELAQILFYVEQTGEILTKFEFPSN